MLRLEPRYQEGLLGLEPWSHIWVFYWFDQNDAPAQRATLRVHPRGNAQNPLTGVFATRSPRLPNLVALVTIQVNRECTRIDANEVAATRAESAPVPLNSRPLASIRGSRPEQSLALGLCRVVAIKENVIEIGGIDAFDQTPVVDIKPYAPGSDVPRESVSVPDWVGR